MGFDYGVSVDHLIVPEFEDQRTRRYELTLRNADEFLTACRRRGCNFVPIGAVQGWDTLSYTEAVRAVTALGYDYIALGGLARSNTRRLREMLGSVMASVPDGVRVHVFGVARKSLLSLLLDLGVASVDSAAPLRQAWLSAKDNYYTPDRTYAAIRIPMVDEERARATTTLLRRSPLGPGALSTLREAESKALRVVRDYARGAARLNETLAILMDFDKMLGDRKDGQTITRRGELYRETLRDKPWKRCPCPVCQELGVEVIIFRGNNRNRRRGFHNLFVQERHLRALSASPRRSAIDAQFALGLGVPT